MTGLCEQAIIPPDCNASFLYCKQCSVTKKRKKKGKKKKKYIQLTRKKKSAIIQNFQDLYKKNIDYFINILC